jgi:hypothetical protein
VAVGVGKEEGLVVPAVKVGKEEGREGCQLSE